MKTKFEHVVYKANNIEESVKFWTENLGFEKAFELYNEDGSVKCVYLKQNGKFLVLQNAPDDHRDNPEYFHACWDVPSVQEAAGELYEKGVSTYHGLPAPQNLASIPYIPHWGKCGSLPCHLLDPSGNIVEFHEITEKSLQTKDDAYIKANFELINENEYVPEAKGQDKGKNNTK